MKKLLSLTCTLAFGANLFATDSPLSSAIQKIVAVGKEGKGNAQAAEAMKVVVAGGAKSLEPTLKAFQGASLPAKNWLRMTVAQIVDADKANLDSSTLKTFVEDRQNDPTARTVAYELLISLKPDLSKDLLTKFLDDPSVDLRRMAIATRLESKPDDKTLEALFHQTRDKDQAELIAKQLEEKKITADLTAHFGYLTTWQIIGPFDSPTGSGFSKSFPAEKEFSGTFQGKGDKDVTWKTISTTAKYGMVNLNESLGKSMDSVAYATTVVSSEKELPCEIRVGSKNAVVIFLNDEKLFEREAYHHGFSMDQHIAVGKLKAGENRVVMKVIQNNQKESWAQDWAFNLRICDATGGKLPIINKTKK